MRKAAFTLIACLVLSTVVFVVMAKSYGEIKTPLIENVFYSNEIESNAPLPVLKKPQIVVKKKDRKLFLYDEGKLIKTYAMALGFAPDGDKEKEGDGKTPEGNFYIFTKNPKSRFYLSLGVSYPDIEDARRGLENKLITKAQHDSIVNSINAKKMPLQNTKLGGEIYIHGGGDSEDWTWGCVALTNENIKELFDAIPVGTEVKIEP